MLHGDGYGEPQDVQRIENSLIAQESETTEQWYRYHREMDRFSVKFSALVKPSFTETYFFSISSTLVSNTAERKSGLELWIDDYLVI